MDKTLRELLAENQHAIWAHWMKYQWSCCVENDDGSLTIPLEKVERWKRQMETAYADLTEQEKVSDRHQADKVIAVLKKEFEADGYYAFDDVFLGVAQLETAE